MATNPRTLPLPFVTLEDGHVLKPASAVKPTETDSIPVVISLRKWIALTHLELVARGPGLVMPSGPELN